MSLWQCASLIACEDDCQQRDQAQRAAHGPDVYRRFQGWRYPRRRHALTSRARRRDRSSDAMHHPTRVITNTEISPPPAPTSPCVISLPPRSVATTVAPRGPGNTGLRRCGTSPACSNLHNRATLDASLRDASRTAPVRKFVEFSSGADHIFLLALVGCASGTA